jgi:hypothetical protein
MADGEARGRTAETGPNEGGVLGNLPRTRPQRATARRAAARNSASSNGGPPARAKRSTTAVPRSADAARTKHKSQAAQGARAAAAKPATPVAGGSPAGGRGPAAVVDSAATKRARTAGGAARSTSGPRARRTSATKREGARRRPLPVEEPAPRQGYESEGERAEGPVQPPGGPELVASAAELVGELAKAGVSVGERLLRDAFSRLPGG